MNISLRKANSIQKSILETIKEIEMISTINLNEFQDPATELNAANNKFFDNDTRRQKLLLALYNIKGLVETATAASGISTNLAKHEFVSDRIAQLKEIANLSPLTDINVIAGMLDKIRKRDSNDEITTSIVSIEQLNQAKDEIKNLKKQKQTLSDEILELNIKTEIPLSDDVVETLTKEGIL
jgi:uncharacterized protein YdcH (DUF465 family)